MTKDDLLNLLRDQIPVSNFMEVDIDEITDKHISLICTLGPNHNHLGTAFGGSLSTMMILSAYCQLYNIIDGKGHVVIKASKMDFQIPVAEDIKAICPLPNSEMIQKFLNTFERKDKAKINLESKIILKSGQIACSMQAEMVAIK